jgi:hypothetical protein
MSLNNTFGTGMANALSASGSTSATLSASQGTTSPEGVVTGYIADQEYRQYHATSHQVVAVWQFRGTIGAKTGWFQVQ